MVPEPTTQTNPPMPSTTTTTSSSSTTPHPNTKKHILVTGGAGYIGSHTVLELLSQHYTVSVLDNLSNSSPESLHRITHTILPGTKLQFYQGDIHNSLLLDRIFRESQPPIWAVVHFAALKSAPESVVKPLEYWNVNVGGSVSLFEAMTRHGVERLVFSSTAAVYGTPSAPKNLIPETHPTNPTNPYGRSKLAVETIIQDICVARPQFSAVVLRYFNPVGAHRSGVIGEDPKGAPGNLVPFVLQVCSGQRSHVEITGTDWATKDGSGVRDFIHVVDLAKGHVAALNHLPTTTSPASSFTTTASTTFPPPNFSLFNMGSGHGKSVLEIISTMSAVTNKPIKTLPALRRPGDVSEVVADPAKANAVLGWRAEMGVKDMCGDAWRWKEKNPKGYEGSRWEGKGDCSGLIGGDTQ
ncbi:hypothetical protein HDV00_001883 [Rhizophlyctis rosea]|nr:hypothetical protein HDV00_001883 [Rhizophlyctis rosea]